MTAANFWTALLRSSS